ncbi:MAG: ferritin-like domain-containing protein, partial [Ferruginibacter sp.]
GSNGNGAKRSNGSFNGSSNGSSSKTGTKSQGMKSNSDTASGLSKLFEDQLKDIYWAEKALLKAMSKMAKNATSQQLRTAIEEHIAVTEKQVSRVEEVFSVIGKSPKSKKCEAMVGLIKEGEEIMQDTEKGVVRDAGIIAASQKIEHYEMASYGTLASFARTLGETEAANLLQQTLDEEKEADQLLTQVAESTINVEAANEEGE